MGRDFRQSSVDTRYATAVSEYAAGFRACLEASLGGTTVADLRSGNDGGNWTNTVAEAVKRAFIETAIRGGYPPADKPTLESANAELVRTIRRNV